MSIPKDSTAGAKVPSVKPPEPVDPSAAPGGASAPKRLSSRTEESRAVIQHVSKTFTAERADHKSRGASGAAFKRRTEYPETRAALDGADRVRRNAVADLAPIEDAITAAKLTKDPLPWVPDAIKKAAPASWNIGPRPMNAEDVRAMAPEEYERFANEQNDARLRETLLNARDLQRDVHTATTELDAYLPQERLAISIAEAAGI